MLPEDAVPAPPVVAAPLAVAALADEEEEVVRPGRLVRFAAGAWHVPGGAAFLLRRPRLWGLALLPSLLGSAALLAGLILGIYGVSAVEARIGAHRPRLPDVADLIAALGLWTATLAAGALGALAIVLLMCAPLLEWLERRAEAAAGGHVARLGWSRSHAWCAIRHSLYLPLAVAPAFVIALVPFAGPLLAGLLVAFVLAFQLTAPALARRGMNLRAMRAWHRAWRAESIGFGVAALILMPLLAPILAPALVTGAARLIQETHGDEPAAPVEDAALAKSTSIDGAPTA